LLVADEEEPRGSFELADVISVVLVFTAVAEIGGLRNWGLLLLFNLLLWVRMPSAVADFRGGGGGFGRDQRLEPEGR
jgi:hypothetical protein